MLVVDNTITTPNTIVLRRSQVKFSPPQGKYDKEIEILDYNKYRGGYLNR